MNRDVISAYKPSLEVMEAFTKLAEEGHKNRAQCSPNPLVCALIVDKDARSILSTGTTEPPPGRHAEIVALDKLDKGIVPHTCIVSLEPCCTWGRTGPCTEALLERGVRKLVIVSLEPSSHMHGQGIAFLEAHGVKVYQWPIDSLFHEIVANLQPFASFVKRRRPWVLLKTAQTLDGQVATHTGSSKWITGDKMRTKVHLWRRQSDAILVGSGTIQYDDPLYTARGTEGEESAPLVIVVDPHHSVSPDARIFNRPGKKIWICPKPLQQKALADVEVMDLGEIKEGEWRLSIEALLDLLHERNILQLMVETGPRLSRSILHSGIVDAIYCTVSPKIMGGSTGLSPFAGKGPAFIEESYKGKFDGIEQVGEDLLLKWRPEDAWYFAGGYG